MLITPELIQRLERSETTRLARAVSAGRGDALELAGGVAAFCGEGHVFTQCVGIGEDRGLADDDWQVLMGHYSGRCSKFEFKLSPIAHPETVRRVVAAAFDVAEFEAILARTPNNDPTDSPSVVIEELPTADVREYVLASEPWFFPGGAAPGTVDGIADSYQVPGSHCFVIRSSGEIVAGASLMVSEGIGWFCGGGVHPDHRRRGLHRALISHRLRVAAEIGLDLVAQGALPASESMRNAQRNGFAHVYTLTSYWISPSGPDPMHVT